jgi:hypothetical protein
MLSTANAGSMPTKQAESARVAHQPAFHPLLVVEQLGMAHQDPAVVRAQIDIGSSPTSSARSPLVGCAAG